jgi:hypothetical protein
MGRKTGCRVGWNGTRRRCSIEVFSRLMLLLGEMLVIMYLVLAKKEMDRDRVGSARDARGACLDVADRG